MMELKNGENNTKDTTVVEEKPIEQVSEEVAPVQSEQEKHDDGLIAFEIMDVVGKIKAYIMDVLEKIRGIGSADLNASEAELPKREPLETLPSDESVAKDAPAEAECKKQIVENKEYNLRGIVVSSLIVILVLITAVVFAYRNSKLSQYESDLASVTSEMYNGVTMAEDASNLVVKVWSNAINRESDSETNKYTKQDPDTKFSSWNSYDVALMKLIADEDFRMKINAVEANQGVVSTYMSDLKNPPKEFETEYEVLKELYFEYITLTELARNPQGSLSTYSQALGESEVEFMNYYRIMTFYNKH